MTDTHKVMISDHKIVASIRSSIISTVVHTGKLSSMVTAEDVDIATIDKSKFVNCASNIIANLVDIASSLGLNFFDAIKEKMEINKIKYPTKLCEGEIRNYKEFSNETGVTKENQSILKNLGNSTIVSVEGMCRYLPELAKQSIEFSRSRGWEHYDTFRNLVLAMIGEVGELAGIVHFKGDLGEKAVLMEPDIDNLAQELADVALYLVRLVAKCNAMEQVCQTLKN